MNDALEMLEYTTILNQIAELTHTEAAHWNCARPRNLH